MTIPTEVAESLNHLRGIVEFAYQQGFHELGYDPIKRIESALTKAGAVEHAGFQIRCEGRQDWVQCDSSAYRVVKEGRPNDARRVYAHAPPADPARYFADGPQGSFYTDDPKLARAILDAYDEGQDWTLTELSDLPGESPAVPVVPLGRDAPSRIFPSPKFEEWFADIWAGSDGIPVPPYQGDGWNAYIEKRQLALGAWMAALDSVEPVASVSDGMVLVSRKDAEAVARFAFNNAGRGLRAPVASAGERILDSLPILPTNQEGAAP